MAAFSASRLVWPAIPVMASTIPPISSDLAANLPMAAVHGLGRLARRPSRLAGGGSRWTPARRLRMRSGDRARPRRTGRRLRSMPWATASAAIRAHRPDVLTLSAPRQRLDRMAISRSATTSPGAGLRHVLRGSSDRVRGPRRRSSPSQRSKGYSTIELKLFAQPSGSVIAGSGANSSGRRQRPAHWHASDRRSSRRIPRTMRDRDADRPRSRRRALDRRRLGPCARGDPAATADVSVARLRRSGCSPPAARSQAGLDVRLAFSSGAFARGLLVRASNAGRSRFWTGSARRRDRRHAGSGRYPGDRRSVHVVETALLRGRPWRDGSSHRWCPPDSRWPPARFARTVCAWCCGSARRCPSAPRSSAATCDHALWERAASRRVRRPWRSGIRRSPDRTRARLSLD